MKLDELMKIYAAKLRLEQIRREEKLLRETIKDTNIPFWVIRDCIKLHDRFKTDKFRTQDMKAIISVKNVSVFAKEAIDRGFMRRSPDVEDNRRHFFELMFD